MIFRYNTDDDCFLRGGAECTICGVLFYMSIVILIGILIIVPELLGVLCEGVIRSKEHRPFSLLLYGYLLMFSLFWLTSIPVILLNSRRFDVVVVIYLIEILVLSLLGLWVGIKVFIKRMRSNQKAFHIRKYLKKYDTLSLVLLAVFLVILAYQLYKSVLHASIDGDDAYYVSIANIANQMGKMYSINPYTGMPTIPDVEHAIAPLPIFMAFVARVSGIHSTIINHLVMPFILIPLTYYAYFLIGERLFYKNKNGIPVFMILISLLQIYGDISIFTKENFFLRRTWQGKSVYANLILTVLFFLMLSLAERQHSQKKTVDGKGEKDVKEPSKRISVFYESKRDIWFFLVLTNLAGCLMTSMSAIISGAFLGVCGIMIAIRYRNVKDLFKIAACCSPCILELILYVVVR